MSKIARTVALWAAFACVAGGCNDDDDPVESSESAEEPAPASAPSTNDDEPRGHPNPALAPTEPAPTGPLDIRDGDGTTGMRLGGSIAEVRPPLNETCLRNHYAERLGERYLRLTCVVAEDPEEAVTIAFLEYDGRPSDLAYRRRVWRVPSDRAQALWDQHRARARAAHGEPNLVSTETRMVWDGVAEDGEPTSLELTWEQLPDADGWSRVTEAYRHRTLSAKLVHKRAAKP